MIPTGTLAAKRPGSMVRSFRSLFPFFPHLDARGTAVARQPSPHPSTSGASPGLQHLRHAMVPSSRWRFESSAIRWRYVTAVREASARGAACRFAAVGGCERRAWEVGGVDVEACV